MLKSATAQYKLSGGVHLPLGGNSILRAAVKNQVSYADRWQTSGAAQDPIRAALYPREAHHIGSVVGQQIAMQERGARSWRRVLHPEASKSGPCADCIADAETTHPIEEPFFEPHVGGVCGLQTLVYTSAAGDIEVPMPGLSPLRSLFQKVADVLKVPLEQIVRRLRGG